MYRFIYKTVNNFTVQYYIGVHRTDNIDDGYIGSGRQLLKAVRELGKSNFKTYILEFAETDQEAFALEKKYVTKEIVNDPLSYNMTTGGAGRLSYGEECNFSEEGLARLVESGKRYAGQANPFYGKAHSEETKEHLSLLASQKIGEKNPFYGKTHSEEFKKKPRKCVSERIKVTHHQWLFDLGGNLQVGGVRP